jgi:serine protease Do
VEITTETVTQSGHLGQYVTAGAGSGVIISKEGYIVTNHHVVADANTITVRLNNGVEFAAYLVGSDEQSDIAVLWIDGSSYPLTVATLGASFDLVVGEDILAIGNPLGSLGGTVTEGMVSATARQIKVGNNVMTLLQVSAPINPGNSGGGLFNMAGELMGIVNAKISDQNVEGLGFAIPVDTAYDIILEIVKHGYVQGRPALGFELVDVTSVQTAMRYFNSFYLGVYVYDKNHEVMRYGDLILSVNGIKLETAADLQAMVSEMEVGDTLEFVVYRNREKKNVTVKVTEQIPETEKNPK